MRAQAVLLAMLGACAPSGLTLEVEVAPGVETVELFVGDDDCDGSECPATVVVPDVGRRAVRSAYFVSDDRPWTRTKAQLIDGYAGFQLQTSKDWTLGILVAVGFDSQGQPVASATLHDVTLKPSTKERWRIKLVPTTLLGADAAAQPPGTETIKLWQGPSAQRSSCLLVEHWTDTAEPERDLVVPAGDHDCDEVPAELECAPWTNNASGVPPQIADASCLATKRIAGTTESCVLGGPVCFENGMTGDECAPLGVDYCMPTTLCGCPPGVTQSECVKNKLGDPFAFSQMPHLDCYIELDTNGEPCNGVKTFPVNASTLLGTNNTKCTDMRLANLMLPPEFDRSIALAANSAAYLVVENFSSSACTAELHWGGTRMAPDLILGVVDLELDNGRHLAIPMRVELGTACQGGGGCAFSRGTTTTTEAMFNCVAPPPTPMYCAPATADGCVNGVKCGAVCCGRGERCNDMTVCECGDTGARCSANLGERCEHPYGWTNLCGTHCCRFYGGYWSCPF